MITTKTIAITEKTHGRMIKNKELKRETFDDEINRLINFYETEKKGNGMRNGVKKK
jgi:predicted CopG family antitoxin